MKKNFTKLFSALLLATMTIIGYTVNAQTLASTPVVAAAASKNEAIGDPKTEAKIDSAAKAEAVVEKKQKAAETDTAWHPQRRLWGYAFGDEYYDAHADATNRGPETMYNGVPTYRNAFQFRRIYLGYDYEITKKFKAEVLLASEPNANTGVNGSTSIQNGDNLVDGKMAFWIKNFNLRTRDLWTGTDLVVGEMSTPSFALNEPGTNGPTSLSETTWGYRSIEKTITDFHKNNSYDVGAALQGTFDPSTKNFGYVFMVGNNSTSSLLSAGSANTGFYKMYYGVLWAKLFDQHLFVDIYADGARTSASTATVPGGKHNMFKIFASYSTKPITIGVEAYTQTLANAIDNTTVTGSPVYQNATAQGLSLWVKGPIVKNLNYFLRRDGYNPYTDFNQTQSYSSTFNTNYGNYTAFYKEVFYTGGLDYNPTKNVHFMPNFWLVDYKDQRATSSSSYVGNDHTLVLRATFFYTFGK